ncbi:alpha/beta fold hydrolase [Rhodoferax sp.]|uniref:alpha/beta fold hydrolase n=1 Tax=Rhodoferax sp. TaxID=50421 RepID=UPI00374DB5BD
MPTAEIARLRARATTHLTPCGDGHIVWHVWGDASPGVVPLLLLHGGSGSWTHWLRNIDSLVDAGRQVWVPDLPGFGDSALPPDGSDADALPQPLEYGLRQLLGAQAVDAVGFSFGGMVGGFLAQAYPERVAGLVLVGAPALGMVARNTVRLKAWRHLPNPAQQAERHHYNLAALMLHDPQAITAEAMELHIANVLRDRIPGRRLSYTDVLSKALQQVHCPVYAIYGREDALYLGQLDALQAALEAAPSFQSLQLIDAAGHWVQYERADAFNKALLQLLDATA